MKLNYFNFREINGKMLLTNDFGKYVFVEKQDFKKLILKDVDMSSLIGRKLLETGMIYKGTDLRFSEVNEYGLRNIKSYLATATSLHIFVVTTACNMNCTYCQANNGTLVPNCYMDEETAEKAVDIALQSPERGLSFEFQGGEPLLNFEIIQHIVEYAECHKGGHQIEYNVVSNLTLLTEQMLDFFERYKFSISTSIDGDVNIHNNNRPLKNGGGSFDKTVKGINRIKNRGMCIGAIETTTRTTLDHFKQMIQSYLDLGFDSIFIRHLTQLGKANKSWDKIGYSAEEFLGFYKKTLDELIRINKNGLFIREQHASIFLKKIKGKRMNYMELRSPCGGGIGQLAYFANGKIFTCDEGRMLAEMGNDAFQLGDVHRDTYQTLMKSGTCHAICASSVLETIPSCCDCVYQPYCGTCPVVSYAIYDDVIEKYPNSFRCKVYAGILDYLFGLLLENDPDTIRVLDSWSE